jgi:hypothetical protein
MGGMAHTCGEEIRYDLEFMRSVFAELFAAVPMDAPAFFREGMSEMVDLNYPQPVPDVIQAFYERARLPSVQ